MHIILTKRIIRPELSKDLNKYMFSLHQEVIHNSGFLKASSYTNFDYTNHYTISYWKSKKDWKEWINSRERKFITNNYNIVKYESHEQLFAIIKTKNIFLL